MEFDPNVWGPHYWFFLHTVAESYPLYPNEVTKKKYYELIQNMPLFIPVEELGNKFSAMLDKYPVSPYLDNRDSFVRWVHFIHNKYNVLLGKPEISLPLALELYRDQYEEKGFIKLKQWKYKKHLLFLSLILFCCLIIYYLYS
jgi:hypothetical protein